MKSSQEAIRSFASFHALQFRQAVAEKVAYEKEALERAAAGLEKKEKPELGFAFSGDQFDAWAVAEGFMAVAACDSADQIERSGIIMVRHQLRKRMNRLARKGAGIDHAYSVEARAARWRIVLIEQFLTERPRAIVSSIRRSFSQSQRSVDHARMLLERQEGLSDTDRMLCMMRLEMAEMSIFNGSQAIEMVVRQISGDKPNMRELRRAMSTFWHGQERKAVRRKGKRAA